MNYGETPLGKMLRQQKDKGFCPQEKTMTEQEYKCRSCDDDHYILHGCCDGRECGCMGQPVSMSVCMDCNHDGKKEVSGYAAEYAHGIELIGQ